MANRDDTPTPEEYLKQLNDQAAAHSPASSYSPATRDPDAGYANPDAQYGNTPYAGTQYESPQYGSTQYGSGTRPYRPGVNYWRIAVSVIGLLVVTGIVLSVAPKIATKISETTSDGSSASDVSATRKSEANDLIAEVVPASDWQRYGKRTTQVFGEGDDVTVSIVDNYYIPEGFDRTKLEQWFVKQKVVSDNLSEARCDVKLDDSFISCSVEIYGTNAEGRRDFDQPSAELSVVMDTPAAGDEDSLATENRISVTSRARS